MNYNNDNVRRQDRLLSEERARALLQEAEWGVLAMTDADGMPYAVPVNYVMDGPSTAYIHCAPEGHKLRALAVHPDVMLTVVGRVNLLPSRFTTEYESVMCRGKATLGLPEAERHHALSVLIDKLSPEHKAVGEKYAAGSFHRTEVIRLDFSECSGKCKRVPGA